MGRNETFRICTATKMKGKNENDVETHVIPLELKLPGSFSYS